MAFFIPKNQKRANLSSSVRASEPNSHKTYGVVSPVSPDCVVCNAFRRIVSCSTTAGEAGRFRRSLIISRKMSEKSGENFDQLSPIFTTTPHSPLPPQSPQAVPTPVSLRRIAIFFKAFFTHLCRAGMYLIVNATL